MTARGARVVTVGRDTAWLVFDDESMPRVAALPKRLQRLELVPGDRVLGRPLEENRAIVDAREPRSFALVRRTSSGRNKTMAANVDNLAIVAAFDRPPLNAAMVDELLAFAELHELRATIILTKPDLAGADERARLHATYSRLGYATFAINPKTHDGIEPVAALLEGRHSLLIGQSGVGKSSLFRALGGEAAVGDVSRLGRGRQTTTSARLYRFAGGFLIDSPGIGEFALHPATRRAGYDWFAEVASGFVEFRNRTPSCRFTDCTHRAEPDCAVRAAVEMGDVARSRYESYLVIVAREIPT